MKIDRSLATGTLAIALSFVICGLGATRAYAQDAQAQGQVITQDQDDTPTNVPASTTDAASGPVRMARFSYLSGNVTWRPDGNTDWSTAADNTPMREGAQIWVGDGGRAELQFDDGSVARLGSGAVVTLQTLFSDSQGEFTEIKLTDGLASLDLRTDHAIYQIDTPKGSVKSVGPSRVRVGVDEDVEIGVREGAATVEGPQGKLTVHEGDYVDVRDETTPYTVSALPAEDSWDQFTDQRHQLLSENDTNLPQNMQYVAGGDLQQNGTWQSDSDYGNVWVPNEPADWQPYQNGSWVWYEPFGWTWVGAETWGWVPYHYGTWVHRGPRWGWVPGPVYQPWSPGVVSFSYIGGDVCWVPLSPWEVHYPAYYGIGIWGGGWSAWFSIGFCGVWYPYNDHWCGYRPWNSTWVNHFHGWAGGARPLGGDAWSSHHFSPANAKWGGVAARANELGSAAHYDHWAPNRVSDAFAHGQQSVPTGRGAFSAGPTRVSTPTARSWSATRTVTPHPDSTGVLDRNVYRGPNTMTHPRTTQTTGTRPFGGGTSAADAANAARQSLGWQKNSTGQYQNPNGYSRGSTTGSGYGSSRGTNGSQGSTGHSTTPSGHSGTGPQRSNKSWSVGDHSGWTHQHSDNGSSQHSSSGSTSGSGGSSRGGGSGGGRGNGNHQ